MVIRIPPPVGPAETLKSQRAVKLAIEELQDITERLTKGHVANTRAASAEMTASSSYSETVDQITDVPYTEPEAPLNVTLGTTGGFNLAGAPRANIQVAWDQVWSNLDQSPVIINMYEIWTRKTRPDPVLPSTPDTDDGTTAGTVVLQQMPEQDSTRWGSVAATTAEITDLNLSTEYAVKIRALTSDGRTGAFSLETLITTLQPTFSIGLPSLPVLSAELSVINVGWDGLISGATPPPEFDSLIIEMSTTSAGVYSPVGQRLKGAGVSVLTGLVVGSTYWIRFRAVDSLGRVAAAPTASVSKVVVGVQSASIDPAVIQTITDARKAGDDAATAAGNAQSTANGKNKMIFSTAVATGTTYVDGDIWWQKTSGIIVGQWEFAAGAWVSHTIDNAVIANISAGKINTGTLDASLVVIKTSATANRGVVISSTGMSAWDSTGLVKTVDINGSTGAVSITGTFTSGSGNSVFIASTNGIQLGSATFASAPFSVTALGVLKATGATFTSGTFTGSVTSTATITGGTLRTAASGQRVELGSNKIDFYGTDGAYPLTLQGTSGSATTGGIISIFTGGGVNITVGRNVSDESHLDMNGGGIRTPMVNGGTWGAGLVLADKPEPSTANISIGSGAISMFASTVSLSTSGVLRIPGVGDASNVSTAHGFQIGPTSAVNLIIDNNELQARNGANTGTSPQFISGMTINGSGGNVQLGNVDSTITVQGRLNATHLPWAFSAGVVTITPVANTPTAATVTLPTGRFTQPPIITLTAGTSQPGTQVQEVATIAGSNTSFQAVIYRTNTTATGIGWMAVQMTSAAAAG